MTLPVYLDSWWEPTPAQFAWAKQQGYAGWLGYFAESGTDRIYHGWADQTFLNAKAAGLATGDYDSGFDDPAWVAARNARLQIVGILDAENSVRPDGSWLDPWMASAGPLERLYGGGTTIANHSTHGHPGYVEAGYPSNSGTANPIDPGLVLTVALNPMRPFGRQYAGGVPTPYGAVDYSHFSTTFFAAQGDPPVPLDTNDSLGIARLVAIHLFGTNTTSIANNYKAIAGDIQTLGVGSTLDKWEAMAASGGEKSDEQDLVGLAAEVKALQSAPAPAPSSVPTAPFTATITPK